jgi:hypothetical protein
MYLDVVKALGCSEINHVPFSTDRSGWYISENSEHEREPHISSLPFYCGICNKSLLKSVFDPQEIEKIGCSVCILAFHVDCIQPKPQTSTEDWICPYCTWEVRFVLFMFFLFMWIAGCYYSRRKRSYRKITETDSKYFDG